MQDDGHKAVNALSPLVKIAKERVARDIANMRAAVENPKLTSALARVQRLKATLLNIYQVWQMRSELFTNDEDCAGSLAERARIALAVARGDCEAQSRDEPHALGDNEREALITALREIAERSYDPAPSEIAQAALTKLEK